MIDSTLTRINFFWSKAQETRTLDWKESIDKYAIALKARQFIFLNEFTRTTGGDRQQVLVGGLYTETTSRKVINFLHFSRGDLARRKFLGTGTLNILLKR